MLFALFSEFYVAGLASSVIKPSQYRQNVHSSKKHGDGYIRQTQILVHTPCCSTNHEINYSSKRSMSMPRVYIGTYKICPNRQFVFMFLSDIKRSDYRINSSSRRDIIVARHRKPTSRLICRVACVLFYARCDVRRLSPGCLCVNLKRKTNVILVVCDTR